MQQKRWFQNETNVCKALISLSLQLRPKEQENGSVLAHVTFNFWKKLLGNGLIALVTSFIIFPIRYYCNTNNIFVQHPTLFTHKFFSGASPDISIIWKVWLLLINNLSDAVMATSIPLLSSLKHSTMHCICMSKFRAAFPFSYHQFQY